MFRSEVGNQMPATTTEVIARAVICEGDRLLVARERGRRWTFLPGGHVEPGEAVEAALIREIAEELGTSITILGLAGVVEHGYVDDAQTTRHEINLVFDATIHGEPCSHEPHLEFDWLSMDQLATADLRPSPVKDIITTGARSVWYGHGH
ncbi:NUDIX domain-containing protein [Nocardia sp. NPDC004654]|uniref:NUDIX domain-containing protein n=1 Tax=Nocardia sp. NPDC004654 TaxID=3154776 RepID=UPI0033AE6337